MNPVPLQVRTTAGTTGRLGLILLGGCLLQACVEKPTRSDPYAETEVAQLLMNPGVEEGYLWQSYWGSMTSVSDDTLLHFAWSEAESVSPTHSLMISASSYLPDDVFGYWTQTVGIQPGQYAGMTLELSASIHLDQVLGEGVSILVVAYDDSHNHVGSAGTQFNEVIRGTAWWREYSVRLTNLSADVSTLYVYLVFLPNTRGTACFDDIELTVLKRTGF